MIEAAFFTVILQVAFLPEPSFAVAVIVTVPAFFAFTTPLLVTVATFLLDDFHTTALLLAFFGVTVAFKVCFLPIVIVDLVLFSFTLVTGVPTVTVTVHFFFLSAFEIT